MTISKMVAAVLMAATASMAQAVTVDWATLTAQPNATTVVGSVDGVGLTYTGSIFFSQRNNVGTDYWVDLGYTQGVVNRPSTVDLITVEDGGTKTVTFARPVKDIYLAFTSWNGNTVLFDKPFTIVSQGGGFWGAGSFVPNGPSTGFFGSGEVHGVLKFAGVHSSITFTDTYESWHGFTVGITEAVPEPASWAMLIAGFGLTGAVMRRRAKLVTA